MSKTITNSTENTRRNSLDSNSLVIAFWIVTGLFCLEMIFTAYYELWRLPDAAQAFARLGFSSNAFRLELSWAKLAGVLVLLIPRVPARLKEWAYAGFAINLISALIAHTSIADRPAAFVPSSITSIFWLMSYLLFRRLQSRSTATSKLSAPVTTVHAQPV